MVALIFLFVVAAVFVSVVALEGGDPTLERRPRGLFTWIASGNWPAKIGGALMVVGVGALLRYAAINFDVPASFKLGFGIVAAGRARLRFLLHLGQSATPRDLARARRRRVRCRVPHGVQRLRAVRLPAHDAGPGPAGADGGRRRRIRGVAQRAVAGGPVDGRRVHGARVRRRRSGSAAWCTATTSRSALLTLAMVAVRGWRPLIHLSFLFTLAGSAFFAWTAGYFSPENSAVMFPLLAMLVAVHVAMPICRAALGARPRGRVARHRLSTGAAGGRGADRAGHLAVARGAGDAVLVVRGHLARRLGCGCTRSGAMAWRRTPSSAC